MLRTRASTIATGILPYVASAALLIACSAPGDDPATDDDGSGGSAGNAIAGAGAGGGSAGKGTAGSGGTSAGGAGSSGTAGASGGSGGSGGSIGGSGSGAGGGSAAGGDAGASSGRGGAGGSIGMSGSGGTSGFSGKGGLGGASGKGGAAGGGQAGNSQAGSAQAGSGGQPETCDTVGSSMTVSQTIRVGAGQTFDGECRRFIADRNTLGDGSEAEGQSPVFEIADGGTLINVVLGSPAADGIHTQGDATLRNITWEDIGEDALTVSGQGGTVTLDGGSAVNSADKVFQINAPSTFRVSNFTARTAGKFMRQNGGTTFTTNLFIDNCDISNMSESIARTDSSTSTVTMTNTRYSNIGDTNFIGFNGRITESNNTEY